MPTWVQLIISAAAVVMAVGTLWKVILPGAKMIAEWAVIMPVLRDLAKQFGEAPGALGVLKEIAAQFRSDSGSTLRDSINRIEDTARQLEGRWKTLELRDEEDRTRAARLAEKLDALAAAVGTTHAAAVTTLPTTAAVATVVAEAAPKATVSATASGLGVGDKLLVKVEDIQNQKDPV